MSISFYGGVKTETGYTFVDLPDEHDVNMSNRNAGIVLDAIGFVGDMWDAAPLPIDKFHAMVFKALNTKRSAGLGFDGYTDGNIMVGGISDDYVPMRLQQMLEFVNEARKAGATVIYWG